MQNALGNPWRPSSGGLVSFVKCLQIERQGWGSEAVPVGGVMAIFSCPACGGHAFKLSLDLKQAHCEDCKLPLGSWQELRARIKQNLRPSRPTPHGAEESTEMTGL